MEGREERSERKDISDNSPLPGDCLVATPSILVQACSAKPGPAAWKLDLMSLLQPVEFAYYPGKISSLIVLCPRDGSKPMLTWGALEKAPLAAKVASPPLASSWGKMVIKPSW